MTGEGRVKEAVKKLLKQYGAYYHMPVQNGMGKPSLDFIGCHRGMFFAIETKAGKALPTPRQALTIQEMEAASSRCFVINEVRGMFTLETWLKGFQ